MRHKNTGSERIRKLSVKKRRTQVQRKTVKVQNVVNTMLRERGWSDKLFEISVFGIWESVVGKELAAHCVPVSLFDGVLRVDVTHQMYTNTLMFMKPDILSKIEKKLKELNLRERRSIQYHRVIDIWVRFNPKIANDKKGKDRTKSESSQELTHDIRKRAKSVSPEMMEQIEAAVSVVTDIELRNALKSLFLTLCSDIETTK